MSKIFIPYVGEQPAAIDIKGHRVLILSSSADNILEDLDMLGGNSVRELELWEDETRVLGELAASIQGGVVIMPPGVSISSMILNLQEQLPWVH